MVKDTASAASGKKQCREHACTGDLLAPLVIVNDLGVPTDKGSWQVPDFPHLAALGALPGRKLPQHLRTLASLTPDSLRAVLARGTWA